MVDAAAFLRMQYVQTTCATVHVSDLVIWAWGTTSFSLVPQCLQSGFSADVTSMYNHI